ncbi:MAG TPA: HD domain-containing protein [Candidatus Avacidaminococcus intestinavium]|uniref:HD domain-containing protein n=1 Tax=Candidatus Avacidaminococcus intestinavium TaxID=2840684 RepID=A0A9D1MQ30_9FIRM|nr:HD domain-containing protein [Candidatus Avacidaminococcus intestinavium]
MILNKDFIEFIYEAAHIQRWNDHIRPQGFTELDKQAHKMLIMYVLARYEEEQGAQLDWQVLIEGGIFEFLHRIVLTDIKPPIFHELMRVSGEKLNAWVFSELKRKIPDFDAAFLTRMHRYFEEETYLLEKKVLRAAHYLATEWEFRIVYHMNQGIYGIEQTKISIANEIKEHKDLLGVQKIIAGEEPQKFVDLVGQLRFQKRWAQSPRVPETSVMGHMIIVAILGYFCALRLGACQQRAINDFLCGLLHDLPEVLTRDIVSPVKRSVKGLDELIKEIEKRQIAEKILPLLPLNWHQEILYFSENEFCDRIIKEGNVYICDTPEEIGEFYNENKFCAIDGSVLKGCDNLAAFVEAWLSRTHGINSRHVNDGEKALREKYHNVSIAGIPFGEIYAKFKE